MLVKTLSQPQISFVAPKSVAKLAVSRNSLRRKGYRALGEYISLFPAGTHGVFIFKKSSIELEEIENEIKAILKKLKV